MEYCPKCENKLIKGVRFCLKCGTDVESVKKNVNKVVKNNDDNGKKCKSKSRLDAQLFDVFLK